VQVEEEEEEEEEEESITSSMRWCGENDVQL